MREANVQYLYSLRKNNVPYHTSFDFFSSIDGV